MTLLIISLYLSRLLNAVHINFMKFVMTALTMFPVIERRFPDAVAAFRAAYDHENDVFEKYARKFFTKQINEADAERIRQLRVLRDAIKTASIMLDATVSKAAQQLLDVIDLYGGVKIQSQKMDARSGNLTNLVEDFETIYKNQVELLNINALVQGLKTANNAFILLMSHRTEWDAKYGRRAMSAARRLSDRAYRNLVESINLAINLKQAAEELLGFVKYLNAEIERLRIQIGQGADDKEDTDVELEPEEEETEDDETTTTPTPPSEENPDTKPEDKPSEGQKPEGEKPNDGNGGGTTGEGNEGNENTGGTPPEEDDPNMPPPGSGGSGFE